MREFPPFRLDTANECLWRGEAEGQRILLTPKAFAVLRYLVEHAGRLVTLDELLTALWPDTFVQPEVLKYQIADIRKKLGDRARNPLFIETLPRRGYRFIAEVREEEPAEPAPSTTPEQARLVGRDRELGTLRACLRRALKGQRQIVFITGEPGIGKTALVDEFVRLVASDEPSIRIARGQCLESYGGAEAYYPMLEALGQLCHGSEGNRVVEILAARAPTWLVQFPSLITREQRQTLHQEILGSTRNRMLREIRDALDTITSEVPLLLVFEDLQWTDSSTVDLISALARQRTASKAMLLATKRPVDMVVPEHAVKGLKEDLLIHHLCEEIKLAALSKADVAEYLGAKSLGGRLPAGFAELIYRHSEGNPLFMVAALDHLTERGLISIEDEGWRLRVPLKKIDVEVPETLRQIIEAQIDHLTPEEQRTLEVASVAGPVFSAKVIAAAMKEDAGLLEELFERLSRRSHIVRAADSQQLADGQYFEFVHALYREVLYRRQTPSRKASLHLSIGHSLEVLFSQRLSEAASDLAVHFEQGGDWERAIKYLQLAAQTATQRFEARQAAEILERALDLVKKMPDAKRAASEIEILAELASIYAVSFETLTRAAETYETLASRAARFGLIEDETRALVDMAYPLAWLSSRRCVEVVARALVLAERQRDEFRRARVEAADLVRQMSGAPSSSRDAENCRIALANVRSAGDRLVLASLLGDHSVTDCDPLNYWAAVALTSERGRCRYMHLLFAGEWAEALKEVKAGIATTEGTRDRDRVQTLRLCQAWIHLWAMDFAGVMEICRPILASPAESLGSATRRFCLGLAGAAEMALGNHEQALQHLLAAKEEIARRMLIWDWYWRMELESALTETWLREGDHDKARAHAEAFVNVTLAGGDRTWHASAWEASGRIAIAGGNVHGAQDCIAKALSTIEGFEVPLASWRVHSTASELYRSTGSQTLAEHHRELSRATILKLANSLAPGDPLRDTFLDAAPVRKVLGAAATAG